MDQLAIDIKFTIMFSDAMKMVEVLKGSDDEMMVIYAKEIREQLDEVLKEQM